MAPVALYHGLFRPVDRRYPRRALRRSVRHRWPHRAGGRARLLYRRMAGRSGHVGARRHCPFASACGRGRCAQGGSNGMRSPLSRTGACSVAALLWSAAWAPAASADSPAVTAAANIGNASGAEIYGHICQGCHMAQAQGAVGAGHYPKLAGDPALVSWQYVALTVLNGKNGMPGFGVAPQQFEFVFGAVHLNDAQVAEVVNYVRSHFGNRYKDTVT